MIEEETLPKGWAVAKLDDVIIRMSNGANVVQYKEAVGLPISRIETISNETMDLNRVRYIKEVAPEFIDKYKLRNGDILFSHINSDSHLGKTALFKIENSVTLIHGINLLLLRPNPEILPEIIDYQIKFLRAQGSFSSIAQKAVNQSSINQAKLKSFEIRVPPYNEQIRILAKLEQLLTDVGKGIEYLKTAQQQLKIYRQAVLKWAFEGKLTNEDVKEGELPKGWKWKTIDDVADISTGVTPLRTNKSYWEKGTIPWITSGALNNEFVTKADEFVTKKAFEETTLKLLPKHTLLLALYGEGKTRGKCSELMFESTTNQAIAGIKLKEDFEQSRRFLKWFLLKNYQDIRLLSAGGVQPNLNSTIVKKTQFPFPPTQEQNKIIKEIESRLSVCDKIEETIADSLQQAEALRLSIIKKAFEGKLVSQDPNDEPAEKLLERIKLEKLKKEQLKKGKNKSGGKIKRIS